MAGNATPTLSAEFQAARRNYKYRCIITDNNGNELVSDEVGFMEGAALAITKQPENFVGKIGDTATFSVEADGEGLKYQWQVNSTGVWKNTTMAGNATAVLKPEFLATRKNYQYRCIITDKYGKEIISDKVGFAEEAAIAITKQPENYVGKVGDTATFSVEAEGADLKYQWQVNSQGTWKNTTMTGNATAVLKPEFLATRKNYKYRCVITDNNGNELISDEVGFAEGTSTLTIVKQPENYTGKVGDTATFSVEAEGEGLKYQWQVNSQGTWKNTTMTGNATPTLSAEFLATRKNYKYRCVITDKNGNELISDEVGFAEEVTLAITKQPETYVGKVGDTATFSVEAEGTGLKYQWQVNSQGTWKNTTMTGNATPTLSAEFLATRKNYKYRCVITDKNGNEIVSDEVGFAEEASKLTIIKQPENYVGKIGDTAKFSVEAEGADLKYQWQVNSQGTWKNTTMTGNATPTLSAEFQATRINYKYRCIITDKNGNELISDEVGFAEVVTLAITKQPESVEAGNNTRVGFYVEAKGAEISYQWEMSTTDGETWVPYTGTGSKTEQITVVADATKNGYLYRCVLTDGNGETKTTDAAKLTLMKSVVIASNPEDAVVDNESNAAFTVSAVGNTLTYKWQSSSDNGKTWKDIANSNTRKLVFKTSLADNGNAYRCVVTDKNGVSATSENAVLTVNNIPLWKDAPTITNAEFADEAVTLEWNSTVVPEGYDVYEVVNGSNVLVNRFTTPETSVVIEDVSEGTHTYKIRARKTIDGVWNTGSYSETVSVTVSYPIEITESPVSYIVKSGANATLSAAATGKELTYQWKYSADDGTSWNDISDATGTTYSVSATENNNNRIYCCEITDKYGKKVSTDTVSVKAMNTVCGDSAEWSLVDGTLTISGTGATYNYETSPFTEITDIKNVVVEEGITAIGNNLFNDCTLESVSLPESLTRINNSAFNGTGLNEVKIPSNVTRVYDKAFAGCSGIRAEVNCLSTVFRNSFDNDAVICGYDKSSAQRYAKENSLEFVEIVSVDHNNGSYTRSIKVDDKIKLDSEANEFITFVSMNNYVATVDSDGIVTAKRAGEASIIAFAPNGTYKLFKVIVSHENENYGFSVNSTYVNVGSNVYIPGSRIRDIYVSDRSVISAESNSDGVTIFGKKPGKAYIYSGTSESPEYVLEVYVDADIINIEENVVYTGNTDTIDCVRYEFTPAESGLYTVCAESEGNIDISVLDKNGQTLSNKYYDYSPSNVKVYELEKGKTYTICSNGNKNTNTLLGTKTSACGYELQISKYDEQIKPISANEEISETITYKDNIWYEFVAEEEGVYVFDFEADGIVYVQEAIGYTDSIYDYRNAYNGYLLAYNYNSCYLNEGDKVYFGVKAFTSDDVSVKVSVQNVLTDPNEDTPVTITTDKLYYGCHGMDDSYFYHYYEFTPETDGNYNFYANSYYEFTVSDENGEVLDGNGRTYELYADETYRIYVYGYDMHTLKVTKEETENVTLSLNKSVSGTTSNSVKTMYRINLTKGEYYFETDNDNTYITVYDSSMSEIMTNKDSRNSKGIKLSSDTRKTYYIAVDSNNSAVRRNYNLICSNVDEEDVAIECNVETVVSEQYKNNKTYIFTVPEDGKYMFQASNGQEYIRMSVSGDGIEDYDDVSYDVRYEAELTAGDEIYISCDNSYSGYTGDFSLAVWKKNIVDENINLGEKYSDVIDYRYETNYTFVADHDGKYRVHITPDDYYSNLSMVTYVNGESHTSSRSYDIDLKAGDEMTFNIWTDYYNVDYTLSVNEYIDSVEEIKLNEEKEDKISCFDNKYNQFTATETGVYTITATSDCYIYTYIYNEDCSGYYRYMNDGYSGSCDIILHEGETINIFTKHSEETNRYVNTSIVKKDAVIIDVDSTGTITDTFTNQETYYKFNFAEAGYHNIWFESEGGAYVNVYNSNLDYYRYNYTYGGTSYVETYTSSENEDVYVRVTRYNYSKLGDEFTLSLTHEEE